MAGVRLGKKARLSIQMTKLFLKNATNTETNQLQRHYAIVTCTKALPCHTVELGIQGARPYNAARTGCATQAHSTQGQKRILGW